jgi:hypothetical protein
MREISSLLIESQINPSTCEAVVDPELKIQAALRVAWVCLFGVMNPAVING